MAIFLGILKWIGITLGGIVGLLLVLIALILFVPVRYKAGGIYSVNEKNYFYKISYLFSLVFIRKKQDESDVKLYILGIPFKNFNSTKDKKEKEDIETTNDNQDEITSESVVDEKANDIDSNLDSESESNTEQNNAVHEEDSDESSQQQDVSKKGKEKKKSKKSFTFKKISSIIGFVRSKSTKSTFNFCKKLFVKTLKYVLPQKIKGEARLGFDDPSITGLLFGGLSLIPLIYQKGVHIYPNFEEKELYANGSCKGRVRMIFLLRIAIKLYFNKELKQTLKEFKNITKKEAA